MEQLLKEMKKYKIVIKYCGGCNPEFDRVKAVASMLDRLADAVEIVPLDDKDADMLVAVEGCPTACADLSGFNGESVVVLSNREAVESFRPETRRQRL